jgi:simple sugar transport system substrate-binding protein
MLRFKLAAVLLAAMVLPIWSTAAQDSTFTRAGIVTAGKTDDPGWDQQGVNGLKLIGQERNYETSVKDDAGTGDISGKLDDLKNDGAQFIVCHNAAYTDTCAQFAQDNQIPVTLIDSPSRVVPNLVSSVEIHPEEGGYLAGFLAGRMTRTSKVAVIVTGDQPLWNMMIAGFAEGLKASNGSAQLNYIVVSADKNLDDAAKDATNEQMQNGVDIVFGVAEGGVAKKMIKAVKDYANDHQDAPVWYIDIMGDRHADEGDVLLTSVLYDFAPTWRQMIADIETRTFGKTYIMDAQNGGVRLLEFPNGIPDAVTQAMTDVQKKVTDGLLSVEVIPDAEGVRSKMEELGYR